MKDKKNNPLNRYLIDMCISKAPFARKLGMSPQRLQHYLLEKADPSISMVKLIEKITDGKVKVDDWIKAMDDT